jgi:hypothetical protein
MKTILTLLSLLLSAAVPAGFATALAGFSVPDVIDPAHAFIGFATSFVLLILRHDYAARRPALSPSCGQPCVIELPRDPKAAHPLAA